MRVRIRVPMVMLCFAHRAESAEVSHSRYQYTCSYSGFQHLWSMRQLRGVTVRQSQLPPCSNKN